MEFTELGDVARSEAADDDDVGEGHDTGRLSNDRRVL